VYRRTTRWDVAEWPAQPVEVEAEPRHDAPTLPRWYAGKPPEGVCTTWMGLR
jgi:hypothetical protein